MKDNFGIVTVYETGNVAVIAVVKSILDDGNIPYFVKGENLQNLSTAGSIGFGYNLALGPIQVQVAKKNKSIAMKLLKHVK
jgi:hypothetical protein